MGDLRSRDPWERVRASPWFGTARWVLPFGFIAAGMLINVVTPRGDAFIATFAAAPLVAAAVWGVRGTAAVGLLAMAAAALVVFGRDRLDGYAAVLRLVTVGLVALLSLAVVAVMRRGERKLASARSIAEAAQLAVLPTPPARVGGLSIAARYRAGQSGARIGGDVYAVQSTPYGVRMLVGDVRGKGLPAVRTVTVVLGAFREAADREPSLVGVVGWIERALAREAGRGEGVDPCEEFVTAVLAEVPVGVGDRVRVVNLGHPPPLLVSADGRTRVLEPPADARPLGRAGLGPEGPTALRSEPFAWGALLLMHTDGVTEARSADGVFYDPSVRLDGCCFRDPESLLDGLLDDIERHTGGRTTDDMALLAVTRCRVDGGGER